MTDERRPRSGEERAHDPGPESGQELSPGPPLDPGTDAEVRRLLGEARETGPPPPDVVARLDATLASLGAASRVDGTGTDGTGAGATPAGAVAPVEALRRRRVRRVLIGAAAAAAVVAVAVPVGLSVSGGGGTAGSQDVSAEAGGAGEPDPGGLAGGDVAEPPSGLAASPEAGPEERGPDAAPEGAELLLSPSDFDTQVAAFVERGGIGPVPAASCGAPAGGRSVAARYEGALATLLLTPAPDGIRARLYVCGDEGVVRRVDVPVQ